MEELNCKQNSFLSFAKRWIIFSFDILDFGLKEKKEFYELFNYLKTKDFVINNLLYEFPMKLF